MPKFGKRKAIRAFRRIGLPFKDRIKFASMIGRKGLWEIDDPRIVEIASGWCGEHTCQWSDNVLVGPKGLVFIGNFFDPRQIALFTGPFPADIPRFARTCVWESLD